MIQVQLLWARKKAATTATASPPTIGSANNGTPRPQTCTRPDRLIGHAGDAFLAVTGGSQIKVYDRDGVERGESAKGDMYIRDLRNTKGHVSPCTGGQWHPADRCLRTVKAALGIVWWYQQSSTRRYAAG